MNRLLYALAATLTCDLRPGAYTYPMTLPCGQQVLVFSDPSGVAYNGSGWVVPEGAVYTNDRIFTGEFQ